MRARQNDNPGCANDGDWGEIRYERQMAQKIHDNEKIFLETAFSGRFTLRAKHIKEQC